MIDPRIAETDYYAKMCMRDEEMAHSLCDQPWASGVRDALAGLFGRFLAKLGGDIEDTLRKLQEFSLLERQSLDNLNLPEQLQHAFYALLHDPRNNDAKGGEAGIMGLAMGDALLARAQYDIDIVPVALLARCNYLFVIGFTEATQGALACRDHRLWEALESLIDHENRIHADPGNHRHANRMAMLRGWQQETDIQEIWRLHGWNMSCLGPKVLSLLRAARCADAKRFLQMAEKLTFPPIASDMLYTIDIRYDFDQLLVLLGVAPNVLDGGGNWNRNMMAPLLLQVAFRLLQDLGNPPGTAEPMADIDYIRSKVRSIMLVLLARPDGHYLCLNWLVHLLTPLHQADASEYSHTLIDESVIQLTSSGFIAETLILPPMQGLKTGVSDVKHATLAEQDAGRAYFHFVIALLMRSKVSDPMDYREALESLLITARSQFGSSTKYQYWWQHWLAADLYLNGTEPVVEKWRTAFDRFAPMLRRARLRQPVKHLEVPSLFLAGVGIAMIRAGTRPEAPPALAAQMADLWSVVFKAAFHAYVCSDPFNTWASVIEDLFRCYPKIHALQGADRGEVLLAYIEHLGGDDRLLTLAITALGMAGLEVSAITENVSQQVELEERITIYLAWTSKFKARPLPAYVVCYWQDKRIHRMS